ncbi:MAG TPA: SGNH/GDSL hydrolase family protein [Xanthobacteraceae bacterium]|nr:SGNH/GDSL hydrolase family protein [Xanthobacteraceae bacterium]
MTSADSTVELKRLGLGLVLALATATGELHAQGAAPCSAPPALTQSGFELPRLARSLREGPPSVVLVLNSSSAAGKVGDGKAADVVRRFPSYLEEALRARYPAHPINVVTRSEPKLDAVDMVERLPELLTAVKPALVIWQAGTYDAIRGVELDAFADAVGTGIDLAHQAGADMLLMSPQFSPRTDFAFDAAPYASMLLWAARSNGAPVFDRYALMRFWDEEGLFDFDSLRAEPGLFENVHRCVGRLLVNMIADGVTLRTVGSR